MSRESLEKFVIDVEEKKELQDILAKGGDMKDKQSQCEFVVKEAKNYGYDFTADEFFEYTEAYSNELSANDLDSVAGGMSVEEGEQLGAKTGGIAGGVAGLLFGPMGAKIGSEIGAKAGGWWGRFVVNMWGKKR